MEKLAIVGLMLMHGLRSAEVIALNRDDVLLSEGQIRARGKGNKMRFMPLAPETTQLLDHYLRLERPDPCSAALSVVLKGPARGQRMTPAGLRSLFRHHRRTTGVKIANPHRGAVHPSPAEDRPVKRWRRPPLQHPLAPAFARAVESLSTALSPATERNYNIAVHSFLVYLAAEYPRVTGLEQLRRDPHALGWM